MLSSRLFTPQPWRSWPWWRSWPVVVAMAVVVVVSRALEVHGGRQGHAKHTPRRRTCEKDHRRRGRRADRLGRDELRRRRSGGLTSDACLISPSGLSAAGFSLALRRLSPDGVDVVRLGLGLGWGWASRTCSADHRGVRCPPSSPERERAD